MEDINKLAGQRLQQLAQVNGRQAATNPQPVSIEQTVGNTTANSIEPLPAEIDRLIDNKAYANKFKARIREGHLRDLLELAQIASTKNMPSRWYAVVTAKANWQATLETLAALRQVARVVAYILGKLKVPADKMRVVYKAVWQVNDLAMRNAALAAEIVAEKGGDAFKLFTWLCWKDPDGKLYRSRQLQHR